MTNLITCITQNRTYGEHEKLAILGLYCINIAYASVANIIALVAIWKLYRRELGRTPKLLISLFVTNLLLVLAIVLLYCTRSFVATENSELFSIQMEIIIFLSMWSCVTLTIISIDRYLLVIRGTIYVKWKKYFHVCFSLAFAFCLVYVIAFHLVVFIYDCDSILVILTLLVAILMTNVISSILTNFLMMRYVQRCLLSDTASRARLRDTVARTLLWMTVAASFTQLAVISLIVTYICGIEYGTFTTKNNEIIITTMPILILFQSGTIPFIYFFRNVRMRHIIFS